MKCINRIKELIRKHSESNNVPKLDKLKYSGKFQKADYLASLLDILREHFDGNFVQVENFLLQETMKIKKNGFG